MLIVNQYIAPLLIIYRAAHGQAYSSDTTAIISEAVRQLPLTDDNFTGNKDRLKNSVNEGVNLHNGREVLESTESTEPSEPRHSESE